MECNYKWNQDILKNNIKRRKFRQSSYTLFFPTDKIKQIKFQISEEISTFLLKDALKIGLCKWQIFQKTVVDKSEYIKIVYSCRKQYCDATLIYHQKKPNPTKEVETYSNPNIPKKYYLYEQKVINQHRHILKLTPKITSEQSIRQYLYDLPVQDRVQNHVEAIKQKFNLTKCQARYLKQRVFWKFKNQDHMLTKLSERNVEFRRKTQTQNDEVKKTIVLLLVTQTMKMNYRTYGDMICFDITYRLLKKMRTAAKHLGVGFFVGQNENTGIILFGMCTITNETSDNFEACFQFFFQICAHVPQTIVTDDQIALGIGIQKLRTHKKYNFVHLLDWFHKLDAIKRNIRREAYKQQILDLFRRLLKQSNKQTYKDIFYELAGIIQNPKILKQFLKNQNRYCISKVPQTFFGFSIVSSRAQSFNNLIKRSVPFQTHLGKLIYFVFRIQKRLINRLQIHNYLHKDLVKDIKDKQILMLWQKMQGFAFQQIRQYYYESKNLQDIKDGISPLHKVIHYIKYQRHYKFNVVYDLQYNCWRCECRNIYRTGLPCAHLFKIIKEYKGCVSYYVNQRWLHNKVNPQQIKYVRPHRKNKGI